MGDRWHHSCLIAVEQKWFCRPVWLVRVELGDKQWHTVRAMKKASSPWPEKKSPRSNSRMVSSSLAGRALKNLMKPPSSSTFRELEWQWMRGSFEGDAYLELRA
jgi:hypothetical protein